MLNNFRLDEFKVVPDKKWIDMFMHSYHIYRALQQLFQKALEANQCIKTWSHFHTHIHITVCSLLPARNRAEQAQ